MRSDSCFERRRAPCPGLLKPLGVWKVFPRLFKRVFPAPPFIVFVYQTIRDIDRKQTPVGIGVGRKALMKLLFHREPKPDIRVECYVYQTRRRSKVLKRGELSKNREPTVF